MDVAAGHRGAWRPKSPKPCCAEVQGAVSGSPTPGSCNTRGPGIPWALRSTSAVSAADGLVGRLLHALHLVE
jgi:hypothetical protein